MSQCIGTNKDGSPCGRQAGHESAYCSSHEPETILSTNDESTCAHENKHFIPSVPDQEYACCEKEKGHDDNHGCLIHVIRKDAEGEIFSDEWSWQEWSDLAGTPVSEIKPDDSGKTRFDVYDEAWQPVNRE